MLLSKDAFIAHPSVNGLLHRSAAARFAVMVFFIQV